MRDSHRAQDDEMNTNLHPVELRSTLGKRLMLERRRSNQDLQPRIKEEDLDSQEEYDESKEYASSMEMDTRVTGSRDVCSYHILTSVDQR